LERREIRVAPKKWSYLEIGIVAYVIYSCIVTTAGGIMFLVVGSVMSAMQNSASQQGLGGTGPNIGQIAQVVGGVLLAIGLIGGVASAIYIAKRRLRPNLSTRDDTGQSGDVVTSHLGEAFMGDVIADAVASLRRRPFFNGSGPAGMFPVGVGSRPPGT
jgi:hypothetical protein